jgi:hypothetical protein
MKTMNRLITLISLTTVVITIERFSPTTRIVVPPYGFLHLHEVVQMGIITAFSVIVSFLVLRTASRNFSLMQDSRGAIFGCIFILGVYFYSTGNGAHEVASFMFNEFCDTKHFTSAACGSMYINDYFFGNVVYFVGLGLSTVAVILFEARRPDMSYTRKDARVTLANGLVLALTFIAYDAFDRVAVGLASTMVLAIIYDWLLLASRARYRTMPFTLYSAVGFTLAALIATPIRLL